MAAYPDGAPRDDAHQFGGRDEPAAYTPVSHAEVLAGQGLRGALFTRWSVEKRRRALEQRYGEEADALLDDSLETTLSDWPE
jgi:hypothetical protein